MFSRHILDFAPLLLQGFEVFVRLISLLRRGNHRLNLLDDGQFLLKICFLLLLLFEEQLLALLLDNTHFGFKRLLVGVGHYLIVFRIASAIDICFQLSLTLCNMQLVEDGFQVVYLILLGGFVAMSNFLHALQNFLFGLILLAFYIL